MGWLAATDVEECPHGGDSHVKVPKWPKELFLCIKCWWILENMYSIIFPMLIRYFSNLFFIFYLPKKIEILNLVFAYCVVALLFTQSPIQERIGVVTGEHRTSLLVGKYSCGVLCISSTYISYIYKELIFYTFLSLDAWHII